MEFFRRLAQLFRLFVRDRIDVPGQEHIHVLALFLEFFVVGMVPDGVRKKAGLVSNAVDTLPLFHCVFVRHQASSHASWSRLGKVILQFPLANSSTRTLPSSSRLPSSTLPSGSVTRYGSSATGCPSSPTS